MKTLTTHSTHSLGVSPKVGHATTRCVAAKDAKERRDAMPSKRGETTPKNVGAPSKRQRNKWLQEERTAVYNGHRLKTRSGLTKDDLFKKANGDIVSARKHDIGVRQYGNIQDTTSVVKNIRDASGGTLADAMKEYKQRKVGSPGRTPNPNTKRQSRRVSTQSSPKRGSPKRGSPTRVSPTRGSPKRSPIAHRISTAE
jgi:hypothetical protein